MSIDVVIPVYGNATLVAACLQSVKTCADDRLGRVFIVDDCSPEPEVNALLARWRLAEVNAHVLRNESNLGFVRSANLGLAASERDVVVLNADTRVTPGWLSALGQVLDTEPRCAAVSPLSNNAGPCSVPTFGEENELTDAQVGALQLGGLPAFTPMPTAPGFCLLLRRAALARLGPFDPAYGRGYHEENDWCQRARAAGWLVGRANRAFVFHVGKASFGAERVALDQTNGWRLAQRFPQFFEDARRFDETAASGIAARAVRAALRRLRRDDFAVVTLERPQGPRSVPWVARVTQTDLEAREGLTALLSSVQGAITTGAATALTALSPTLRVSSGTEPSIAFLTELALEPDVAALARQW